MWAKREADAVAADEADEDGDGADVADAADGADDVAGAADADAAADGDAGASDGTALVGLGPQAARRTASPASIAAARRPLIGRRCRARS